MHASVCRSHAFGRCCMFTKSLLITFSLFPCCSLSLNHLPIYFKTVFFKPVQVFNQSLVSTAKCHITLPVDHQCNKNYSLRKYHLLLFTTIRNVCKTKHNLIFVRKLVKKLFQKMIFCICIIVIFVIFENLCFTW